MVRRCGHICRAERPVMFIPPRRIVPAVGSISLTVSRAVVDLPHPDSPTMPSVSPARTEKEIPSTANTEPILRPKMPRRTGKCLARSSTSRTGADSGMRDLCGALRMPAGREMARRLLLERGHGAAALIGGKRATGGEHTTWRARAEARQHAGDLGETRLPRLAAAVDPRHGAEQAYRVGMTRAAEQRRDRRFLHFAPRIHDY